MSTDSCLPGSQGCRWSDLWAVGRNLHRWARTLPAAWGSGWTRRWPEAWSGTWAAGEVPWRGTRPLRWRGPSCRRPGALESRSPAGSAVVSGTPVYPVRDSPFGSLCSLSQPTEQTRTRVCFRNRLIIKKQIDLLDPMIILSRALRSSVCYFLLELEIYNQIKYLFFKTNILKTNPVFIIVRFF